MAGMSGHLQVLGDDERAKRRATPRVGITLAGVGMLMIVFGVLVCSFEGASPAEDEPSGDPNTTLGVILSLVVILVGYAALIRFRRGPLATAGVVASALGVPILLGFATYDPPTPTPMDEFSRPFLLPFQLDVIVLLSLLAWLISYAVVPSARGRTFYIAASTFFLWLYVLEKVEEGAAAYVATLPFSLFAFAFRFGDEGPELPEPTTIGAVTVLFGVAYYVIALLLDVRGRHGMATPFVVAGFVTTALGLAHLAGDLEPLGTGVMLILFGALLTPYGATQSRRFTTWVWGAAIGFGVLLIIGELADDNNTGFGIGAILLGIVVIGVGYVITVGLDEPDELAPGPSRFERPPPRPPAPMGWPPPPPPPPPPGFTTDQGVGSRF